MLYYKAEGIGYSAEVKEAEEESQEAGPESYVITAMAGDGMFTKMFSLELGDVTLSEQDPKALTIPFSISYLKSDSATKDLVVDLQIKAYADANVEEEADSKTYTVTLKKQDQYALDGTMEIALDADISQDLYLIIDVNSIKW